MSWPKDRDPEAPGNWYIVDFPDKVAAEEFAAQLRKHHWVSQCNRRNCSVRVRPNVGEQGHEMGVPIIDLYSRLGGVMRPSEMRVARSFLARSTRTP